jgi:ribose transport system ATP-binding protein
VLGIAGLIGAGRTELLRALFGLDRVARASSRCSRSPAGAIRACAGAQGVGLVSEDRKREGLAVGLSVADNLCLPRLDRLGRLGFVAPRAVDAAARRMDRRLAHQDDSPGRARGEPVGRQPAEGGARAALVRGRRRPAARRADARHRRRLEGRDLRRIDELARGASSRAQCAVVVVSSYLPELLGVCDRIAVMSRGRLGPARDRRELDEHALLREMTGGAR